LCSADVGPDGASSLQPHNTYDVRRELPYWRHSRGSWTYRWCTYRCSWSLEFDDQDQDAYMLPPDVAVGQAGAASLLMTWSASAAGIHTHHCSIINFYEELQRCRINHKRIAHLRVQSSSRIYFYRTAKRHRFS